LKPEALNLSALCKAFKAIFEARASQKRPLGRPRYRWMGNIKMGLIELE
jgi:hypothetical protein